MCLKHYDIADQIDHWYDKSYDPSWEMFGDEELEDLEDAEEWICNVLEILMNLTEYVNYVLKQIYLQHVSVKVKRN